MNDISLYEKIPVNEFPIRLLKFSNQQLYVSPHWHEHTEMLYFFSGTGKVACGGKIFDVKKGDLIIVNQNELHACMDGVCAYGCILLPPSFFDGSHAIFENLVRNSEVQHLAGKIFGEFTAKETAYKSAVQAYTYMLVTVLTRKYASDILDDKAYMQRAEKLNKINKAIEYINDNYAEDISTSFLSETVHISVWHFCRLFKEVTGKTPKEYINDIRIDKACGLIKNTDMTVTEIALCCGFGDMNYFSRYFKMRMGMPPTKYAKSE